MEKGKNAPAKAGATPEEVVENAVVETATQETAVEETATEETATEETAVEETATEETAVEETAVEETATEETAVEETATEVVETLVNGEFEVNGKIWKLSDRCPARLKFNGTIYSRNELLTNEELQQSLVIGKSPFVKKA